MKIEKVTGIVLSDTNYSESSKILNVLTKEHGKIGIISKGCRNLKSSLRSVSSKLTYGYFNIYYKLFWCINRNAYWLKRSNISFRRLFWNPGSLTIIGSKIILKILSKIVYFLRNLI